MDIKEIEIFSEASSYGIVRMPGRKFPGCVIQGDSLSILLGMVKSIKAQLEESPNEELLDEVNELYESINGRLAHYISVLDSNNIEIPFNRSSVNFDVA